MKNFGISLERRIGTTLIILLPIVFIVITMMLSGNSEILISRGYVVFYLIYGFFFSSFFIYLIFSSTIKLEGRSILLTRIFKADKEYDQSSEFNIQSITLVSIFFKIYKVKIRDDSYFLRYNKLQNLYKRVFNQKKIANEMKVDLSFALRNTN